MILANPYGGIGNQLFGYAFIRAIQEETGERVVYCSRKLFEGGYIKAQISVPEYIFDYYKLLPGRVVALNGRIPLFLFLALRKWLGRFSQEEFFKHVKRGFIYSFDEKCPCDDISKLPLAAKLNYIEGYFQWPSLFLPLRDKLREEISLKEPLNESAQFILQEIKGCESVCLHVRRGDYLEYDFYDICHYQYYRKAMEYVDEKVTNPFFYIFSNDIDWVEKNYEIPYPHRFVKENHKAPFELELMRNCKHFIISNSSFSWWAQFLAENESAVVVVPCSWFGDRRQCSVYLPHWYTIDPFAVEGTEDGTG